MSEEVIKGNDKNRMLNDEEWWELFDRAAHYYLNISGDEFVRKWKAGEFEGQDTSDVVAVYMLMPPIDGK